MIFKKLSQSVLYIFAVSQLLAQQSKQQTSTYPRNYFRPPLELSPDASGSFGELRSGHFHSGTDYRTLQRVGHPVYAAADGYILRARVQLDGGGNALYIDHPNGYTSVYMHMLRFNEAIGNIVKSRQYTEQRFDVDFMPGKDIIPIKKGDVIGLSGNSGSSGGPHLHFEIRNTRTEMPVNAQLFGLTIPDAVPPVISDITVYDLGEEPFSENTPRRHLRVLGSGGQYNLSPKQVVPLNGKTGFGIIVTDQSSTSSFRYGVYSIELLIDDIPVYTAVWESLNFDHGKAINAHIDYPYYMINGKRIQKSFVEPGNPLNIYKNLVNQGIIQLKDSQVHIVRYLISDVKGNISSLTFNVQRNEQLEINPTSATGTALFAFNKENIFKTDAIQLSIPANSLYSNLHFKYTIGNKPVGGYSALHHVHNRMIPLDNGYSLAIKPDNSLPARLYSKALIADSRGQSQGGHYDKGFVKVTAGSFGSFYVVVDTIAPVIRALNLSEDRSLAGVATINFKISDNLSGIQSFNGYIDDQWVLMEYDPKTASLWHTLEQKLPKGRHHFKLVVTDWKDNEKIFEADFFK